MAYSGYGSGYSPASDDSTGGGTTPAPGTTTQVAISRSTSWNVGGRPSLFRSTSWATFSTTTTVVRPAARFKIYAPTGPLLGPLPSPESASVAYPLNDVGGLTFNYSLAAPKAELLGQTCEIAIEISPDSGRTWVEPPDSRFVYLTDSRDPTSKADKYAVEAKSYVWRLSKSKVWGEVNPGTINSSGTSSLLNADGKRAFVGVTVGKLLLTLITEARGRFNAAGDPGLKGIDTSSFTLSTDSAGKAWNQTLTIYYEPGLDYLAIIMDLADQGYCDFRMQGRALQVFNPETRMANDRTVGSGQVVLRTARDIIEAPMRRTWEGLADSAYFSGGDGARYNYTNPQAVTPWGRQETFISNGSVTDPGTMAALTQAELAKSDQPRVEYTRGLDFSRAVSKLFWDYSVGDYVWSDAAGPTLQRLRVRQLTLTISDKGVIAGNAVLNDRFLEADVRAARRIAGITNGASSGPGTGGGAPSGSDTAGTPAKVGSLTGSSAAYMGPGGFPQAQVTIAWQQVTRNADGLLTDDIDHYEIFQRPFGQAAALAKQIASTTDTDWSGSPYVVGSSWVFQVRAVNSSGKRGEKSNDLAIGMAQDTVPPQAPSTPIITARLGTVSVQYDGKPAYGTWPLDFDHIEVHSSPANNFTPSDQTRIDTLFGAGVTVITNGEYGVPIFVKFVAVDTTGLESDPSAQAFGIPARLVGSDLDADAITFEQIQYKDSGNLVFDGSFEDDDYRANLSSRSSSAWTFTTADYYHGSWSATINAATAPSTSRQLVLMQSTDAQQIQAADKLFCRMAYKGAAGATGVLQLVVQWTLRDGTTSTSTLVGATKNGTWQQIAGQLTAPALVTQFRVILELTSTGTSGSYSVDAVEVRRTVGTAIIQDAAVGNAQINNLAVNNAKIADLSAGKLTAGTLSADVLVAGRLMTATSGNRVELSSTGVRLYRGSTVTAHLNPVNGQLRVYNTGDATHTSANHGIQFGDDDGYNLVIDNNELMARFNGDYSTLFLNREGGRVSIGGIKNQLRPDPETWLWPASNNQVIDMNGSVQVNNARTSFQGDQYHPLNVGPRTGEHMWFDWQSIGSSGGAGGPNAMHISPPHPDYDHLAPVWIGSDSIAIRRIGSEQGGVFSTEAGVSLQFYQGQVNARSADSGVTGNRSMGASSFVVLSQESTKHRIGDLTDALDVVRRVKSKRWQFRDHINPEDQWHYGPVLEELPAELHMPIGDDQKGYDVVSLVGLLWQAFRDHLEECNAKP